MYAPIVIAVLLVGVGLLGTRYTIRLNLRDSEQISNIIQIWACVAAAISAAFVIPSYVLTNRAFIESQRPALLVQVTEGSPTTLFRYANTSSNPFYDLTFTIKAISKDKVTDLGDLFRTKMYMAAHDDRTRRFDTKEELKKHGLDLDEVMAQGKEIVFSIEYMYTFLGKVERVKVQEYSWEEGRWWSIRH